MTGAWFTFTAEDVDRNLDALMDVNGARLVEVGFGSRARP